MTELQTICSQANPTAHDLYSAISSDTTIADEIMRVSRSITKNIDSLTKAIIVLGVNTTKNIALMISESAPIETSAPVIVKKKGVHQERSPRYNNRQQDSGGMDSETKALTRTLANHLMDLDVRERMILTLSYYEEMTLEEIAEIIGVSENNAAKLHKKALEKFNKKIQGHEKRFALTDRSN